MSVTSDKHRKKIIKAAAFCVAITWSLLPEAAFACEGCFGAGVDSATVRAIGASMMVLIVLMGFMGGGIFTFFNRAHVRAAEIELEKTGQSASSSPDHE